MIACSLRNWNWKFKDVLKFKFSMSSSRRKCCVFHWTNFRVASAFQSRKPHQSQTVAGLLHRNHFFFFLPPNANYCSPDRRHKHTMALNRKPPAGSSQPWSHSFQRLFIPGVIRAASHRLVHNGDLSNAQSEHFFSPFFFLLWLITDCLKCHLLPSSRSALCSSCPRVIAGQRPLCTICHLITDRFESWGGGGPKLWVQRACEHWWVMEQTCENQHGGVVISCVTYHCLETENE